MGKPGKKPAQVKEKGTQEKDPTPQVRTEKESNTPSEEQNEQQRFKQLEEVLITKKKKLEACRAKTREKSLKQKIEEAEAEIRMLNEEIQKETDEVTILDPTSATKSFEGKEVHNPISTIDTESPLLVDIQLAK